MILPMDFLINDILHSYVFGHRVTSVADDQGSFSLWSFDSTGEPVTRESIKEKLCPKCGLKPTDKGHDPCIADLPGVDYACCGHGVTQGYVKFSNGVILTGEFNLLHQEDT